MTAAVTDPGPGLRQSVVDEVGMWADLWSSQLHAQHARLAVTRRAELFMQVAGLPLGQVLDALGITEDEWAARVVELRRSEVAGRIAYRASARRGRRP